MTYYRGDRIVAIGVAKEGVVSGKYVYLQIHFVGLVVENIHNKLNKINFEINLRK